MNPDQERRLDALEVEAVARLRAALGAPANLRAGGDASMHDGDGATDLGEVVPLGVQRVSRWPRRLAVAAVVLAVAGVAAVVAADRVLPPDVRAADGKTVTLEAGDCGSLSAETSGWSFDDASGSPAAPTGPVGAPIGAPGQPDDRSAPVTGVLPSDGAEASDAPAEPFPGGWSYPARWYGDRIEGEIAVDGPVEGSNGEQVWARFIAEDGTEVPLIGTRRGASQFQTLGCRITVEPWRAVTERHAELVAQHGSLPPAVGPAESAGDGFQYRGMRAEGEGADRSTVLRFHRAARTPDPGVHPCAYSSITNEPECTQQQPVAEADVRVCTTTGDGCRAEGDEQRRELSDVDALPSGVRAFVVGPAAAVEWWASLPLTADAQEIRLSAVM